ncbi:MAG: hypothetical protein AAGB24_13455 [Bacteroidota bacterium]
MTYFKESIVVIALCLTLSPAYAQYEMKAAEGYSPQIGFMVYMLEGLKSIITNEVKDLNTSQTDFMYDADANSVGSLIMHLVSTARRIIKWKHLMDASGQWKNKNGWASGDS